MGTVPVFASPSEAMQMVRAGLDYLAAADATAMAAQEQARCLRGLEHANSVTTAARTSILGAFAAGQGHSADADYSPRAWLIHKTGVTKGAAVAYTAWVKRAEAHPLVAGGLAAGEISESVARTLCLWTDKLREDRREEADKILADAAVSGLGLADLAGLFAEMYERSRAGEPDRDKEESFEDRALRLVTTLGGAGVLHGDLTPECAAAVQAVLDALSAPADAEDTRTQEQRCHDALGEAMRRLAAAGMLPERAGQPVKVWVHIPLAELLEMDGSTTLVKEWVTAMRAAWAAHRAAASEGGGDIGAWLDGDAARAVACDAAIAPVVTGEVNPAALDDMVRLCVQLDKLRHGAPDGTAAPAPRARSRRTPPGRGRRSSRRSSARLSTSYRVPAASPASCAAASWACGWAAPACRWTSATPRPSRPAFATRSSCAISAAGGPAAATSPRRRAKSTTSGTRPTAARPAPKTASFCVSITTRS